MKDENNNLWEYYFGLATQVIANTKGLHSIV